MKYPYFIKEYERNGVKRIYFSLDEKLLPVSRFINTDITGEEGARFFINRIKKVQNGEVAINTVSGNSTVLTIKPGFVVVKEMFFNNEAVSIETAELIQLIETFLLEKKIYMDNVER